MFSSLVMFSVSAVEKGRKETEVGFHMQFSIINQQNDLQNFVNVLKNHKKMGWSFFLVGRFTNEDTIKSYLSAVSAMLIGIWVVITGYLYVLLSSYVSS